MLEEDVIFSKQNDNLAVALATKNKLDMDKVLSAYLVLGDDLMILLHIFEGQTLHIPSKRNLTATNLHNIQFIEDDEMNYADYEKNDSIEINNEMYSVLAPEKRILNHIYIPVIKSTERTYERE